MTAVLALLSQYRIIAYALACGAIFAAGVWYHHHVYQQGYEAAEARYEAALIAARAKAREEMIQLQAIAKQAEHAHDQELSDLHRYRASHPVAVRVCPPTAGPDLSGAAPAESGDDGAGTTPGGILPMPPGDRGERAIGGLFDALAGRCDAVAAQLREWQAR